MELKHVHACNFQNNVIGVPYIILSLFFCLFVLFVSQGNEDLSNFLKVAIYEPASSCRFYQGCEE